MTPNQPPDWAGAVCREVDPDLWFPGKGGDWRQPKAMCLRCPVLAACRGWALRVGEPDGIWGGLSPSERGRLRKSTGVAA